MEDPANEASGSFGPSHKSPAALEAAFDSAATTRVDTNSTQQTVQNGLPKRVFKMKRTGFSTLPQNTTTRELSSSNAHPPATPGHLAEREPKAVQIISYLPSRISTTPVTGTSVTPSKAQSASSSARKTKYATDEERRKATSIALKQRWASGVMANVHKKRLETIRRRKEAEALLGTPGIAKSSSSVVDLKQATKSSKSLTRLSWVPNSDARQAHEARERPVVSEQFSSNKRRLTAESATSSSHEDLDAQSENSTWLSISSVLDGDQAVEQPSDEDESKSRTNNDASFITMAASDRAYSKWRDERGSLIPTYGALIPEGYKFSTTTPGRPWICPVRSCRKVFAKLRELGSHFNRGHRGAQLHDNEDGTLSERTTGRLRRPSSKLAAPFPAVVISRGPPDPAEAPAVEPSFPTLVPGKQLLGVQDASMLEGNDDIDLDTEGTTNTGDEANIGSAIEESQEATPITTNGVPTNIAEAEPGRPYTMWPDENGELVPTYGSLLPAGYQLDNTIPGRPWVCPVRTCRTSHCKRSDLGFHFMRVHFAACLNDNCDGTFTVKGNYQNKATSLRKGGKISADAPPIVVSREPLTGGSPIPEPQLPSYLASKKPPLGLRGRKEQEYRRIETRISLLRRGNAADLWAYIQPRLNSTTEMPSSTTMKHLLSLPKQRDVKYNTHRRRKPFIEKGSRDVAAMIIQVTGDEVLRKCKRCGQGKGPFEGCVVVAQAAHDRAKRRYPCCANCLFGGKKLQCTLAKSTRTRTSLAASAAAQSPGVSAPSKEVNEAGFHGEPRTQQSTVDDGISTTPASPSLSDLSTATALASHGTFQCPHDMIEMEDWEIAPGRIRGTSIIAEPETIAFSKPYLSNTTSTPHAAVPVCDDVGFRVDTVQPGDKLLLDAEADKTRLCSVAAGKVRVSIGGEPEFVLGPHGLFKVRAGAACTVRNELSFDAVLHTVVLGGY